MGQTPNVGQPGKLPALGAGDLCSKLFGKKFYQKLFPSENHSLPTFYIFLDI